MAEGSLAANGTVTVTLDDRVAQVIVSAAGGELWVTTDGSNPDHPKAGTVRVIPSRSPQAITVSSPADPTVVKLRSPKGAGYTVIAGPQTDADSAAGMGAVSAEDLAGVAVHDHDDDYEAAGGIATHAEDTTSVHGIDDTSLLATTAQLSVVTANRQTASYTLVAADVGKVVEMNVADANTLTFPPDVFSAGDCGEGVQWGAGQVTLTEGVGVDIRSSGDKYKTTAQYSPFSWRCVASNEFHVSGELSV